MNPSTETLYESAIRDYDCLLSNKGSLVAMSGIKTGRSPMDKRIVRDSINANEKCGDIWWGNVNMPISKDLYDIYKKASIEYFELCDRCYCIDAYGGWDNNNRIKVRVYCKHPYHALFMKNMLIPSDKPFDTVDFVIYNMGQCKLSTIDIPDSLVDNSLDDTLVAIDLLDKSMVIFGTEYAGEMKKGVLTYMMYIMPLKKHLPMHASANVDVNGNVSIFFGLSGTGKTTLSTDPEHTLIGDDEHVWTDEGIFNIEGGCYAKCINLDKDKEPEIYNAIRYGSVMENILLDEKREPMFNDTSITKNTRVSYPLNHIQNVLIPAKAGHPANIFMLTCDTSGLLPPVGKLTPESALFMFVNGYTSKIPGTEIGVQEPYPTFSSCFAEPFLIWSPDIYGRLLEKKIKEHKCRCWLINTGWVGGKYGEGKRIDILHSRQIIKAIQSDQLTNFTHFPVFNFQIPTHCPNVPTHILNPALHWADKKKYIRALEALHEKFADNYTNKIHNTHVH